MSGNCVSFVSEGWWNGEGRIAAYGFPSGPRTTPGGNGCALAEAVGAGGATLPSVCESRGSSAIVGSRNVNWWRRRDALLDLSWKIWEGFERRAWIHAHRSLQWMGGAGDINAKPSVPGPRVNAGTGRPAAHAVDERFDEAILTTC